MPFLTQTKTNWKFIGIVAVLAAVIGVGILWFLPKQEIKMPEIKISESEESEVNEDMTIEELENAEYYIRVFDKNVEFKDGNYEEQISESGAEFAITAGIYPDYQDEESKYKIAFGDLNNDKKDDAAVILFSNTGGSGSWIDLAVILNSNGEPIFIDSVPLGDRTRINSIIINKEIITLDMLIHGPNDAMCCPTLERIAKYKLSENKLLEVKDETADPVPSEVEGWQAYRNEEYGFEIKTPPLWQITEYGTKIWTFEFQGPNSYDYCNLQGHYWVGEVDLFKEAENYFSGKKTEITYPFEFNRYEGIKIKTANSEDVFITSEGFVYYIPLHSSTICDKIFSTFRFIE